jgi:phage shock protein A
MHVFQRLKRALSSSVGGLLDDIENHEAVVEATLREVERNARVVRDRRDACQRRIETLEQRALVLDDEHRQWRERARRLREEREKALECVRRLRTAAAARKDTLAELAKQKDLLAALSEDDRAIAGKLDALRRRAAHLTARQARAEVNSPVLDQASVDEVLGRWEARVVRNEALASEGGRPIAAGSPGLTSAEEAALVSAELDRLLAEEEDR